MNKNIEATDNSKKKTYNKEEAYLLNIDHDIIFVLLLLLFFFISASSIFEVSANRRSE